MNMDFGHLEWLNKCWQLITQMVMEVYNLNDCFNIWSRVALHSHVSDPIPSRGQICLAQSIATMGPSSYQRRMAWISNFIQVQQWDIIHHPCPDFLWSLGMDVQLYPI